MLNSRELGFQYDKQSIYVEPTFQQIKYWFLKIFFDL